MMTVYLKVAARLAFSADWRARWRQTSLISAAILGTVAFLLGAGLIQSALRGDQVRADRTPVGADSPAAAVLLMSQRGLITAGSASQFPVIWLEPAAGKERERLVPPGLSRLPEPGSMVVSPSLLRDGLTPQRLGMRQSQAGTGPNGTIGPEGLVTDDERWAYARPQVGRSLGDGGALTPIVAYGNYGNRFMLDTVAALPDGISMTVSLMWLALVPALLLIGGASRSLSEIRMARAATLFRLGAEPKRIRVMLAAESAILAIPGIAVGLALYVTVVAPMQRLPFTTTMLHPGALLPPTWLTAVLCATLVVLVAFVGALGRLEQHGPKTRRARSWQAIPCLVGLSTMVAVGAFGLPLAQGRQYLYLGLLLTICGMPLAIPAMGAWLGRHLSKSTGAIPWLIGQRLREQAVALTRPAGVVAVLALVAGATVAIHARMVMVEPEQLGTWRTSSFVVDWRDEQPGDLDRAMDAIHRLGGASVFALSEASAKSPDGMGANAAIVENCHDLVRVGELLGISPCVPQSDEVTRDLSQAMFNEATSVPVVGHAQQHKATGFSLVIIGEKRLTSADVHRSLGFLPALNVAPSHVPPNPNPLAGMLFGGFVLGAILLLLSAVREVANRALIFRQHDRTLDRLGLPSRAVDLVRAVALGAPALLATVVGGVSAICFALVGNRLELTIPDLTNILLAETAVGGFVLAAIVFAVRSARRSGARN